MKIILATILLSMAILSGCNKYDIEKDVPKCIKKMIKGPIACGGGQGANAKEYWFQNKTVYVIDQGDCHESFSVVLDTDCNHLGTLDYRNAEINGEEFYANATYIRTVWEQTACLTFKNGA